MARFITRLIRHTGLIRKIIQLEFFNAVPNLSQFIGLDQCNFLHASKLFFSDKVE